MTKRLTLQQAARRVFRSLPVIAHDPELPRPITRGDCEDGPRPCPWLTCRYHLANDVYQDQFGNKYLRSTPDWTTEKPSCALDVADDGPKPAEFVAFLLGVKRQRVDAIEVAALRHAREKAK